MDVVPQGASEATQFAPCVAYLSPVKSWSVYAAPEIVSSARIEMTASVFMTSASISIVAKNGRARRIFGTNVGELRGRRAATSTAQPPEKRFLYSVGDT